MLRGKNLGECKSAFGFLRLVLASLVIVAHTPELVDGDRQRELLTRAFGSLSFGELAVNGFFVVSGFLITGSFLKDPSPRAYLTKRIARIYPAFAVCSLICVFIIGPMSGAYFAHGSLRGTIAALCRVAILAPPTMANVFAGSTNAALNGASWTIQYEFLCYLLVIGLGAVGALRCRSLLAISVVCLSIAAFAPIGHALNALPLQGLILDGDRLQLFRLVGLFCAGATFYIIRDHVIISKRVAVFSAVLLCVSLFVPALANIGFAIFGSYAIFAAAAFGSGTFLAEVNSRDDISYGVYLYAWPIEKLLIWFGMTSLFWLGTETLVLAIFAGTASWFLVEKPAMRHSRYTTGAARTRAPPIPSRLDQGRAGRTL